MKILLVDDWPDTPDRAGVSLEGEDELDLDPCTSLEEALEMSRECSYDAVVTGYRSTEGGCMDLLKTLREGGRDMPLLIVTEGGQRREESINLLGEILRHPELLRGPKPPEGRSSKGEVELLSEERSVKSAFSEVWRVGNYVMKMRRDSIEEAEDRIGYQLELRDRLDFLPKYYGMLVDRRDEKEIVVNFYEYVEPIEPSEFSLEDLKEILEMVKSAYEEGYHGIDLKHSNFGRKNKKIYYLDEGGIGKYAPQDWTKLLTEFLQRVSFKGIEKEGPE